MYKEESKIKAESTQFKEINQSHATFIIISSITNRIRRWNNKSWKFISNKSPGLKAVNRGLVCFFKFLHV